MNLSRTRRRTALAAVGVLIAAGLVGVPTRAYAAVACDVTYTTSDWNTGFTARVQIKNLGDPVNGWTLGWTFPNSAQRVTQYWQSIITQSGAQVSAKNLSVSPQQVLSSELLDRPLTRLMVAPSHSGAAAVVLSGGPGSVLVRASLLVDEDARGQAARLAYDSAGLGPEDLDCAEVDDVTAAAELAAYEDLQLAPAGQGPELIDSGFTSLGGVTPVNPSGGLLSSGELPGASALAQIVHVVRQLRGEAGPRQVERARVGLAQSGGEGNPAALTILGAR